MNITLVGTGYVGLVTGTCFANVGNDVTCLDVDISKIEQLSNGESPFYEPGLSEMMTKCIDDNRLHFTCSKKEAYEHADVIFICVGTPTGAKGECDLSHVFGVADDIAKSSASDRSPLIIVKSTVPVGTTHKVRERIPERMSIANNPEFLREGNAIEDFRRPDRVVCGVDTEGARTVLTKLYAPFVGEGRPLLFFDIPSSEMVKYASNAMLACKISFINEIASLCERNGANIDAVRTGMCADNRIGTAFFRPGIGYGGSCFPKDTLAVMEMGQDANAPCLVNTAVHELNLRQRAWFAQRVIDHFGGSLEGKRIAFWGLAFKPRTDDVRDAPSIDIAKALIERGAEVIGFDPEAAENFSIEVSQIELADDMYAVTSQADALVICTEWPEFGTCSLSKVKGLLNEPLIFDGRNMFDEDTMTKAGFTYYSVGRPTVTQSSNTTANQ
ncbi:MAG: UDP-glucose/GDP-mannose dehydrogenase family protein [Phycisphaerales bacterium]|nr:UDP-glucose/GDP-mannose dehydrogenase family protein [Phycisphaerales bacterium]